MKNAGSFLIGLLGIIFVYLKLTHQINWSWWWVTLPFWAGTAVALVALIVIAVIAALAVALKK